jgi:hypothetical protein
MSAEEVNMTTSERTELDKYLTQVRRNVWGMWCPALTEGQAVALTLWPAGTHVVDPEDVNRFGLYPRIAPLSDSPGSGKSTILSILAHLSYRGEYNYARSTTAPGMLRAIQEDKVVLCLDQLEYLLSHTGRGFTSRLDIIESGFERQGSSRDANGKHPTWGPAAFACLRAMFRGNPNLEALRSRTIQINTEPLPEGLMDERDLYRNVKDAGTVKAFGRRLHEVVMRAQEDILNAPEPQIAGVRLRMSDKWGPLLKVAEAAGGKWPDWAASACRELSLGTEVSSSTLSPIDQLELDIEQVIMTTTDNLSRVELMRQVAELTTPWYSERQGATFVNQFMEDHGMPPADRVWISELQQSRPGWTRDDLDNHFRNTRLAPRASAPDATRQMQNRDEITAREDEDE